MDITGKYLLVVHDYCVTSDCVFIPVATVSNLIILGGGAPLLLYLHIILVGRSHSFPSDPVLAYLGQVPYLLGHHGSSKDEHMTLIVLSWDSCCKDLEQEHTTAGPLSEQGASIVTVNEQSAKEANA